MLTTKTKQILIIIAAVTVAVLLIASFAVYAYLMTQDPKVAQTFAGSIGSAFLIAALLAGLAYIIHTYFNQ
jgi:hypothetical protein